MSDAVLVVGLGNPGPEYERTRHNVGALVIDLLCDQLGERLRPLKGVRAFAAEARDGETRVILARTTTYMNESGEAVGPLARYFKIEPADIIVVHDELDLPLAVLRVKDGGSDAGHNGLKSVTRSLKTGDYVRVRIGVGRPAGRKDTIDHVLQPFAKAEQPEIDVAIERAAEAVRAIARDGVDRAREAYSDRPEKPPKPEPRAIQVDVTVPATSEEVFEAFATSEGATTFFAPEATIEPEVGGRYELYFDPDAPEGERGSEGCTILAMDPPGLLVFGWNAPPSIPTVRAARKTRVELRLRARDEGTKVRLTHSGWGTGEDWDEAFAYFERAWRVVLDRLRARFDTGPIDWDAD